MAVETCLMCKKQGFVCETPHMGDQNKAKIVVTEKGAQFPVCSPIEKCARRSATVAKAREWAAVAKAYVTR